MSVTRQQRRYRVADLHGTLQFSHPASVVDLSRSGIAIESSERVIPGRLYPLQLEGRDGLLITTSARVVWCKLTGTTEDATGDLAPLYRAGLEFQGELPGAALRLFEQVDQRLAPRVETSLRAQHKISEVGSTLLLREQTTFEVKTISRRGMGAEMAYSPRVGSILEFVLPLEEPTEMRGRVADVNPAAEDPTAYLVGVEFIGLSPTAQGRIERYVEGLRSRGDSPES
jgi:hypothetical protein